MKLNEVMNRVVEYDKGGVESEDSSDMQEYLKTINGEHKELGRGAFGVAFEKSDGVNTVIKTGKFQIMRDKYGKYDDAYVNYVVGLQKIDGASNNPYLPQVFNIKFYQVEGSNKSYNYKIELEKLKNLAFDLDSIKSYEDAERYLEQNPQSMFAQVLSVIERVTSVSGLDFVKYLFSKGLGKFGFGSSEVFRIMSDVFSNYIGGQSPGFIKITDESLIEALEILGKVKSSADNKGMGLDLHHLNIMYRPTPYGMQWVFVDPFS